jgi:hypothetical protein
MNMTKELIPVQNLSGMSAIFARGFITCYIDGAERLRECQEAGLAAVKEFETDISVSYISTLTRKLRAAGVIIQEKRGRSFYLSDGPNIDEFLEFIGDNPDYGTRLTGTEDEDTVRAQAYGHLEEHGAILSRIDNQIPKAAYKMLIKKFQAGELNLAFIKADLPAGVKYNGTTHKIEVLDA